MASFTATVAIDTPNSSVLCRTAAGMDSWNACLLMVTSVRENAHVRQHMQDQKVKEQEPPPGWVAQEAPRKIQSQSFDSAKSVLCLSGLFLSKLFERVDRRSGSCRCC